MQEGMKPGCHRNAAPSKQLMARDWCGRYDGCTPRTGCVWGSWWLLRHSQCGQLQLRGRRTSRGSGFCPQVPQESHLGAVRAGGWLGGHLGSRPAAECPALGAAPRAVTPLGMTTSRQLMNPPYKSACSYKYTTIS